MAPILGEMMVLDNEELEKLERDFVSGRNPRAYIPLCNALRRERMTQRALEICQRAMEGGDDSLAGRMLLIRLLADQAHYDEALEQTIVAERQFGESVALLVERANCQIKLMQIEEAVLTHRRLDELNPFDPRVGMIGKELREMRARTPSRSSEEVYVRWVAQNLEEIAAKLRESLSGLGKVHTIAILDLDSDKTCVEGSGALVEAAETFYGDSAIACDELGQGQVSYGIMELTKLLMLVVRRGRRLVVVAVDPQVNFGRFLHRVQLVMQQYLATADTVAEEDVPEPEPL